MSLSTTNVSIDHNNNNNINAYNETPFRAAGPRPARAWLFQALLVSVEATNAHGLSWPAGPLHKDIDATYVLLSRTGVWLTSFYACKAAAVKKIAERIVSAQCGTLIVPMKNTGHQKYEPLQPAFYDEAQLLSKYLGGGGGTGQI